MNNLLNIRYYPLVGNTALGFDYTASLSPSLMYLKERIFKKNIILLVKGGFSAVCLVIRYPEFSYTRIESQFLTVGKYNRLFFEVGIAPKLKYSKENRFYIAYVFDAYTFGSSNDDKRLSNYVNGIKVAYWLKTK